MTKAMEEARAKHKRMSDARQLWKEHGGSQHGPHTETLTIPLANFGGFVDALISAARAQVKAAGCPFDGPNDLELTDPCPICGSLGTHDSDDHCPFPGRRALTAGGQHG